jgi:hypothetical protein
VNDPIVDEIRRMRDAHAARFDYDLDAIFRDIKERERKSGHKFVDGIARPAAANETVEPAEVVDEGKAMSDTMGQILKLVENLTIKERAELAHAVLLSKEPEDPGAEEAWDKELAERATRIRAARLSASPQSRCSRNCGRRFRKTEPVRLPLSIVARGLSK